MKPIQPVTSVDFVNLGANSHLKHTPEHITNTIHHHSSPPSRYHFFFSTTPHIVVLEHFFASFFCTFLPQFFAIWSCVVTHTFVLLIPVVVNIFCAMNLLFSFCFYRLMTMISIIHE